MASDSPADVYVAIVNDNVKEKSMEIVQNLRRNSIRVDTNIMDRNLTKQLEYADGLGIPYVVIVGEKELKKGRLLLKDMVKKTQNELTIKELISFLGKGRRN